MLQMQRYQVKHKWMSLHDANLSRLAKILQRIAKPLGQAKGCLGWSAGRGVILKTTKIQTVIVGEVQLQRGVCSTNVSC